MLLDCLRYLLTFLLLTAAAPQSFSAYSDDVAVDQAPTDSVAVGHRTPDPADVEQAIVLTKALVKHAPWPPAHVQLPAVTRAPRCTRRVISRIHWVRRRIPRLRDDAADH